MEQNFNIKKISFDTSLARKLYENSGGINKGRGYILCCLNADGEPIIVNKCSSTIIEMGLRKCLSDYLVRRDDETMVSSLDSELEE